MTREQFIAHFPIVTVLEKRGVTITGSGVQRMAKCCFHEDKQASLSINVVEGTWFCHAGCGGGSVIDLLAKLEGKTAVDILREHGVNGAKQAPAKPQNALEIEKIYQYHDALGGDVYQVVRYKPKTFRQRHPDGKGGWVWSMEGVERVLYRLTEVQKSQTVWVVEGEKDADSLAALGYTATCNVGGAGKWLDGYTEALAGKDVILCGDNDEPGRKHIETVFESIAGKVKSARMVSVPKPHKDVSDYAAMARTPDVARAALDGLSAEATPFLDGIKLPIFTMAELEPRYQKQVRSVADCALDLGKWLPSLGAHVRPLVPGELVLIIGDTGTGKSAMLQNIALAAKPVPTLFFELELPDELMFERFLAMQVKWKCVDVEQAYRTSDDSFGRAALDAKFPHLFICAEPRLTLDQLEKYITRSELKIGHKPKLVCLDYVQLVDGQGKRYERTSDTAEGLKVIAKATKTIIVMASQVHRSDSDDPEINLHSGKDSGALENSSGLVMGAWRDPQDKTLLYLKVLKNTKGTGGFKMECNFDGEKMTITQRTNITDEDVP